LEELDKRLLYTTLNCRFVAFRILGNEKGGFFVLQANFARFKPQAVMHVIELHLTGLFDNNVVSTILLFME
jgi:hypothetical protein